MSLVRLPTRVIINDDGITKTTISYHKHSNNLYYPHKKISNIARKTHKKHNRPSGLKYNMKDKPRKPRTITNRPSGLKYERHVNARKDKGVPRKSAYKTRKDKGVPRGKRGANLNIYRNRYEDPLNFERKKKLLEDVPELIGSINLLELQKFLLKNPDIDPEKTSLIIKILA